MPLSRKFLPLVLVASMTAAGVANAAEPETRYPDDPAKRMTEAVDKYVFESVMRLIEPGQALRLVLVARQYAASARCEGFVVDDDKYRAIMNDIVAELAKLTKEGQNNLPVDVVMAGFNTSLGGQLAVAAYDKEAFCSEAKLFRDELKDPEGRLLILKPAS